MNGYGATALLYQFMFVCLFVCLTTLEEPLTRAAPLTQGSSSGHGQGHLRQQLWGGLEGPQGGSDAPRHSHHAQGVSQTTGALRREARQRPHAAQAGAQVHHLR